MTQLLRLLRPSAPRVGALLVCGILTSTAILLTGTPLASALNMNVGHSRYFAGYVATPTGGKYESAQVSFRVPTLTCTKRYSGQNESILQYMTVPDSGTYAGAYVAVDCDMGSAEYVANVMVEGYSGSCSGSLISVSPGHLVTLTETEEKIGNSGPLEATVSAKDKQTSCEEFDGYFPPPDGTVWTGICGYSSGTPSGSPVSGGTPPTYLCGTYPNGLNPKFTPVAFRDATIVTKVTGNTSLGWWNPQAYNMKSDGTLMMKTSFPLKEDGESFTVTAVQH